MSSIDLSGRVALVTGGGRGIGAAIAKHLADAGAAVGVNYISNADAAQATVGEIESAGGVAAPLQADVADADAVAGLMTRTTKELGPVDVLVANAGVAHRRTMEELTEAEFNQVLQTNLTSAFLCSQAVIPGMRERGWGRLIYVSSGAAYIGGRVGLHYAASKGGMEALVRGYAKNLAGEGVTANSVAPALIQTEMSTTATPEQQAFVPPVGRTGHVDEVAMAVVMLAANGYMTGQTLHMNGGIYFN